jgi:GNAT superfamily N-acetyltransferase
VEYRAGAKGISRKDRVSQAVRALSSSRGITNLAPASFRLARAPDDGGGIAKSSQFDSESLKARKMYRIREVDAHDDEISDTIADLHRLTFFDSAAIPEFDHGHWWLAFDKTTPVGFAGVIPSTRAINAGYFCRVGILQEHCGNALQLRLMRALEARARHNGWNSIVSDTTDNLASANNFIRAGYRLYQPPDPWAWPHSLYWRKSIR